MCEPTTLLIAATALSAVGSGVAGYGSYQQGQFNQKISEQNAAMARRNAEDSLRRGNLAEAQHRREVDALKSSQKVGFAANNVVISSGSPLSVLQSTAEQGELDALTIRTNAERQAAGFTMDAQNSLLQGKLSAMQGKYGLAEGALNAGSTIIGGVRKYKGMT